MPELVVGWIMEMGDAENVFVDFEIGHGMIIHPEGRDGKAGTDGPMRLIPMSRPEVHAPQQQTQLIFGNPAHLRRRTSYSI